MKINSKIPKTFIIFLKQSDKEGYLRYHSHQTKTGDIYFTFTLEKNQKNSSKFVNFDNVKKIAKEYAQKYNFEEVKIIDEKLLKIIKIKN